MKASTTVAVILSFLTAVASPTVEVTAQPGADWRDSDWRDSGDWRDWRDSGDWRDWRDLEHLEHLDWRDLRDLRALEHSRALELDHSRARARAHSRGTPVAPALARHHAPHLSRNLSDPPRNVSLDRGNVSLDRAHVSRNVSNFLSNAPNAPIPPALPPRSRSHPAHPPGAHPPGARSPGANAGRGNGNGNGNGNATNATKFAARPDLPNKSGPGCVWIAIGLSSLIILSMVSILLILWNLDKRRRCGRKTNSLSTHARGSVTSLQRSLE